MSVEISRENGIGYSKSVVESIFTFGIDGSMSVAAKPTPGKSYPDGTTNPQQTEPRELSPDVIFAPWGHNNLLPNEMVAKIDGCGSLQSAIFDMTRFFLGKGARPYKLVKENPDGSEELEPIGDNEIKDWLEENDFQSHSFALVQDYIGLGNYCARLKFTNDGSKIGLAIRHDVAEMRLQKKKQGIINNAYLSAQWKYIFQIEKKTQDLITLPLLPYLKPAAFLSELAPEQRKKKEFVLHGMVPGWLRHYYAKAKWLSVEDWVDISRGVPKMKAAIFENAIRLKYIVIIYDTYWIRQWPNWASLAGPVREAHRQSVYDSIDGYLAGAKNAYKSIFVPGTWNAIAGQFHADIEIKSIEDTTKIGELLPDASAADKQIMFALGFNPAINGANLLSDGAKGGAGSGSDIREAITGLISKGELERGQITKILNIVSRVNGWLTKYPNLVWRFPGLILTTLDKGKSAEPVKTGA